MQEEDLDVWPTNLAQTKLSCLLVINANVPLNVFRP